MFIKKNKKQISNSNDNQKAKKIKGSLREKKNQDYKKRWKYLKKTIWNQKYKGKVK